MKKLFLVPTILSFAALPSQVKRMRDRAVALGVRLSGELVVTLSGMAAWGPPLVVPLEYTGGTALTVKTATRADRATNGMV